MSKDIFGATTMASVLIVEDEAQVLIIAASYLAEHGYETHSASSIAEATAILDSDATVDILFTDLGLSHDGPQAGLELAKQAIESRPNLKVLYTTGKS
jgi:DNA-binding NtrC family response regulator